MNLIHIWLRGLVAPNITVGKRERILSCIGAAVGLFGTEWICRYALGASSPWFIAPMGASAVLLFAAPASPLAQPRAIIVGNLVSALIGVAVASHWGNSGVAAGLAVSLSIAAMFGLRCLHPPSGAVALCAVLGDAAISKLGYGFAIWPVTINSVLLLLAALLFNNFTGRRYPHQPVALGNPHHTRDPLPQARSGLTVADLEAVLNNHGELLDVCQEDLIDVLMKAEHRVLRRRLAGIRCKDIMSRDVISASPSNSMQDAWHRLNHHKVKALPVLAEDWQLAGIISLHDIFMAAGGPHDSIGTKRWSERRVGEIMNSTPVTVAPDQSIADLATVFSDGGMHHLPVVDARNRVVGMLSQSDYVGALQAALK